MAEVTAGTVIDGRYKVLERLGSGGMADVFLAEDDQLGRKVALKLLHRRFSEDPGFVERFRREAQSAAGLQHPNVVSVYDRGTYGGTYYIAMEYLPGRSLKQLIRQEAPLDPVRAIDITIQILKAARFAHRHGVIHRDLKPHNVIVDDAGHVKVTDFGIARAGASDMTETGSIMGTAQYLSPEQAQGHAVSASSDLYSIGVVLYELLTGQVPFDAEAAVTIALKHVSEAPTAPTRINPRIPPELEQVVMWTLNKNPGDRPKDADELIAALESARRAILSGSPGERTASMAAVGVAAVAAGMEPPVVEGPETTAEGSTPPPSDTYPPALYDDGGVPPGPPADEERKRRLWRDPWLWVALLLALLLAGGAAAYFLTKSTKQVLVPNVINQPLGTARTILQNEGFEINVTQQQSKAAAQTVIGEIPPGGKKVDEGSTVALTVSSGPASVNVPPVVGDSVAQARNALTKAGLKVGRTIQQSSDQFPSGSVIDSSPSAGQPVPSGSAVTLVVSSGKAKVNVPDVTGENQQAAKSDLTNAGFKVTTTTQQTTSTPAGNVISQSPSGGTQAIPGSFVTIVVAQKQAPTTAKVPGVTGQTAAQASSTLKAAGFGVSESTRTVKDQSKNGIVLDQSPAAGSSAKKGSTVAIVVGKASTGPTGPTGPSSSSP
jgi:serine/threonine-protein kinase